MLIMPEPPDATNKVDEQAPTHSNIGSSIVGTIGIRREPSQPETPVQITRIGQHPSMIVDHLNK